MRLEDFKPGILQMSPTKALELHKQVRLRRLEPPKPKVTKSRTQTPKARKTKAEKIYQGKSKEDLQKLLAILKGT